jgi:LysW-gamma-L-lysine carboxypeptidase
VVLLGHIDTVEGYIPVRVEGGRLYGRGAVDAKGPMAAFISAAARLAERGLLGNKRLLVVGAVEEEAATSKGARQVMEDHAPDYAVIGEPSGWDALTLGYKGRLLARWRVNVRMRHTAVPEPSVVEQAVNFWLTVRNLCGEYNRGVSSAFERIDPSFRRLSSGGDGFGEWAEAVVAFRLPPGVEPDWLKSALQDAAGDAQLETWGEERAYRSEKSTPIVRAMLTAIREVGGTPRFKLKTGTSDMNVVATRWQCPMVAYGPGDSALDHTPEEHIEVEDYRRAIEVLVKAISAL